MTFGISLNGAHLKLNASSQKRIVFQTRLTTLLRYPSDDTLYGKNLSKIEVPTYL